MVEHYFWSRKTKTSLGKLRPVSCRLLLCVLSVSVWALSLYLFAWTGAGVHFAASSAQIWWFVISTNLFYQLVSGRDTPAARPLYHFFAWGIPAAEVAVLYIGNHFRYVGLWCWIDDLTSSAEQLVFFYFKAGAAGIASLLFFIRIMYSLKKKFHAMRADTRFSYLTVGSGWLGFAFDRWGRYLSYVLIFTFVHLALFVREIIILTLPDLVIRGWTVLVVLFGGQGAIAFILMSTTSQNFSFWFTCCGIFRARRIREGGVYGDPDAARRMFAADYTEESEMYTTIVDFVDDSLPDNGPAMLDQVFKTYAPQPSSKKGTVRNRKVKKSAAANRALGGGGGGGGAVTAKKTNDVFVVDSKPPPAPVPVNNGPAQGLVVDMTSEAPSVASGGSNAEYVPGGVDAQVAANNRRQSGGSGRRGEGGGSKRKKSHLTADGSRGSRRSRSGEGRRKHSHGRKKSGGSGRHRGDRPRRE